MLPEVMANLPKLARDPWDGAIMKVVGINRCECCGAQDDPELYLGDTSGCCDLFELERQDGSRLWGLLSMIDDDGVGIVCSYYDPY